MDLGTPNVTLHRVFAALTTPGVLLTLIAFFLPWYSISCGSLSLATATGYDSATHGFRPPPSAQSTIDFGSGPGRTLSGPPATLDAGGDSASRRDLWLALLPVCSLVALIAVGRALFTDDKRRSALVACGAAFASGALPIIHAAVTRGRLHSALAERAGNDPMQRGVSDALQQSIQFHLEIGWYLTICGGLLGAVAAAFWWRMLASPVSSATTQR